VRPVHFPDALDEKLRCQLLEHEAAHAETDRFGQSFFVERRRYNHDSRKQFLFFHLPEHDQAVFCRHLNVEHQNIRLIPAYRLEGFIALEAAGDNPKILFQAEQIFHRVEDQG
jgi:hypothetical protein